MSHFSDARLHMKPETPKAEILTWRGVGRRLHSDTSTLDTAALAEASHRERENNALPEGQLHASCEQLSKEEVASCHAHPAQRPSSTRVET